MRWQKGANFCHLRQGGNINDFFLAAELKPKLKNREWSVLGSFARLNHPTPTSKCPIMQLWELIIEWNDVSVWNWKHLKCIVLVPTRSKLYRRWRRIRILSEKQPAIQTRCHPAKLWKYPRFTLCVYCCSTSHKWKQICRVSIDLPRWICWENLYMRWAKRHNLGKAMVQVTLFLSMQKM